MWELARRLTASASRHWSRSSLRHGQLAGANNRQLSLRRFANDKLEIAVCVAALNLGRTAHDVDEFESVCLGQQKALVAQGNDTELLLAGTGCHFTPPPDQG